MKPCSIECVSVAEVAVAERQIVANLMQLYLHDFSEFAPLGSTHGEVSNDGRFAYPYLDSYWHEKGRIPLLIRAGEAIAGFVLVNQWSALERPLDHAVAEFFVLRKYRRAGVGSHAAKGLFESFPGEWEVAIAAYNAPALDFWRTVIPCCAISGSIEVCASDGMRWSGTVIRFRSKAR
jgi:predicted acetyltransferase